MGITLNEGVITMLRGTSQVLENIFSSESPPHVLVPFTTTCRVAVVQQGCIAFHEGDRQLLEEVADRGALVLSSVASKCATQLLDLCNGTV